MTPRGRVVRWSFLCAVAAGLVVVFPTWETFWCVVALSLAWIGGTCAGIMVDEYWPAKQHSPREWTSHRNVVNDFRRWR